MSSSGRLLTEMTMMTTYLLLYSLKNILNVSAGDSIWLQDEVYERVVVCGAREFHSRVNITI